MTKKKKKKTRTGRQNHKTSRVLRIVGTFRLHPKGHGLVIPEGPGEKGEVFVPIDRAATALTGDRVAIRMSCRGKRRGAMLYVGEVIEVLKRAATSYVGILEKDEDGWFVTPDGKKAPGRIAIRNGCEGEHSTAGAKVTLKIVEYSEGGKPPIGEVSKTLGLAGDTNAEIDAIICGFGLASTFSEEVDQAAERVALAFEKSIQKGSGFPSREDLSRTTIVAIDPEGARDHDDAVSLEEGSDGAVTLGVHIADVSYFVKEGGVIDEEARSRGTSVYFPRRVVPMLPAQLSTGVCSLKQGEPRLAKSVFITYDKAGTVISTRFAESVVTSKAGLTYEQAQAICDGKSVNVSDDVADLVRKLERLARKIDARRLSEGMLHLDLPEVQLIFSEEGRVVDAAPGDSAYSHTMIEMFMVEANEAVATLLDSIDVPYIRRVHPEPDEESLRRLESFSRACGHEVSKRPARKELLELLNAVRGAKDEYAVNLAVLRSLSQAKYDTEPCGHYALASERYCHFTSPIRRYPDLTIHRLLHRYCLGKKVKSGRDDEGKLADLATKCSEMARRAEGAENELRQVLVLWHLQTRLGHVFDGVITGISDFGVFIQSPRFLIEGLLRLQDLGDEWWDVSSQYGLVRGERTGSTYRIGDSLPVRITGVDVAKRHLNLSLVAADR
ncbi:MAG: VacB/RNase II family 3'-5' exoribonuclease [Deltaproteobacteria bacterium]|nr:VacB/RNase II family 3'-5' exoribonuclease [Deltaproteobacteria bacterium]